MPHLIIIDRDGNPYEVPHDTEGNRSAPIATTFKDLKNEDHPPSEITIQSPTMELAEKVFKVVDKYYKKQ